MGAVSDIKKSEEYTKKPPLFKKLFAAGSVEEEALQTLMAKKKAEDMREQLKQIISFTRGPSAWEELLRTEADIRKKRQMEIYDREEKIQKFKEWIGIGFLINSHRFAFLLSIPIHQRLHLSETYKYFIEYLICTFVCALDFTLWSFWIIWYLNKLNTKYVRKLQLSLLKKINYIVYLIIFAQPVSR